VEYLRDTGSTACLELDRLLREERQAVATTEPVVMELLAGAPTPAALAALETLTNGLPLLTLDSRLDFHAAAATYRSARQQGRTVRTLTDCLIAVIALRHGATLLHRDADFEAISECLPGLDTRSLR
jgi:predicted nucleic acid-binding protein